MADVVVVGAGIGGLSAAVRLAASRHRVVVCEQAETIGGKAGRWSRDGFTFDTGPTLLTLPAVYRDLFATTGPALEDVLELDAVDPVCHYRFADGTELTMPNASRAAIGRAVDESLGPGTGDQWLALLRRGGQIWAATREQFLGVPLAGPGMALGLARAAGPTGLRTIAPLTTLRGLGHSQLDHPHLRTLLDRYATYAGSDPRRAPAALASIPYVEQAFGAWTVRGGLHELVLAVAARAERLGAEIRTAAPVVSVRTEHGRATGVELSDGSVLPADVVVCAADASHLYRDLLPAGLGRRAERARRAAAEPGADASLSGFVLLLGLEGRTGAAGLGYHRVLFGGDYDDELDAVFGSGKHRAHPRPVDDPTIYLSAPGDPSTRPDDDSEAVFVLVNAPRHRTDDPRYGINWDAPGLAHAYGDHVLSLLAERGIDVRRRVRVRDHLTPADLERRTGSPGGAIYGLASHRVRGPFSRPANASPVGGLYLAGATTHPGGGLPLVGMSAEIVARLIGPA